MIYIYDTYIMPRQPLALHTGEVVGIIITGNGSGVSFTCGEARVILKATSFQQDFSPES
jgi:hypothetical protein